MKYKYYRLMARYRRRGRRYGGYGIYNRSPGALSGFGAITTLNYAIPFYTNNTLTYYGAPGGFMAHYHNLSPEEKLGVKIMTVELYGEQLR
jgi:hypothetical protein